jgi:hypothetical protein
MACPCCAFGDAADKHFNADKVCQGTGIASTQGTGTNDPSTLGALRASNVDQLSQVFSVKATARPSFDKLRTP